MFKIITLFLFFVYSNFLYSDYRPSFMITNDGNTIGYLKLQDNLSDINIKLQCNNIYNQFVVYLRLEELKSSRWNSFIVKKSFDKRTFEEEDWKKVFVNNEFLLTKTYVDNEYIKKLLSTNEILVDIPQLNRAFIIRYENKEVVEDYINIISNHCNINNN